MSLSFVPQNWIYRICGNGKKIRKKNVGVGGGGGGGGGDGGGGGGWG